MGAGLVPQHMDKGLSRAVPGLAVLTPKTPVQTKRETLKPRLRAEGRDLALDIKANISWGEWPSAQGRRGERLTVRAWLISKRVVRGWEQPGCGRGLGPGGNPL